MKVAIFDFDGTLYKKETFSLLMQHLKEHATYGAQYKRFYASILFPCIAYKIKLYPEGKMKANLMQKYLHIFKGKREEEVNRYFNEVAQSMQNDLNKEVVTKLHQHAKENYYIMVVSGAYTPLLSTTLQKLPIDIFIGTEIPMINGMFAPNQPIDHVRAERKTELINRSLQNKSIDWEQSVAYGDSYADVPVLKMVGNPVAVSPDEKLHTLATRSKWNIIQ